MKSKVLVIALLALVLIPLSACGQKDEARLTTDETSMLQSMSGEAFFVERKK